MMMIIGNGDDGVYFVENLLGAQVTVFTPTHEYRYACFTDEKTKA